MTLASIASICFKHMVDIYYCIINQLARISQYLYFCIRADEIQLCLYIPYILRLDESVSIYKQALN